MDGVSVYNYSSGISSGISSSAMATVALTC